MSNLYIKKSQPVRLWLSLPDETTRKSHQEWLNMENGPRQEPEKAPVSGPALYLGDPK